MATDGPRIQDNHFRLGSSMVVKPSSARIEQVLSLRIHELHVRDQVALPISGGWPKLLLLSRGNLSRDPNYNLAHNVGTRVLPFKDNPHVNDTSRSTYVSFQGP